jgi:pimeloyl-[acyl-carrier protein] methyl ester esterase
MSAPRITLLHGWGYDATLWREVVPLLNGLDVELCDLGYFGKLSLPAPCDAPRIAVGHSLGALWWLTSGLPWQALIAINAFPRFIAGDDFPQGVAPRVLDRMRKRFAETPAAVLADFQKACGGAGPALPGDAEPLTAGLEALGRLDGRSQWSARAADIRLLAGRRDAILPPALTDASGALLSKEHFRCIEHGGHLLPLTHPAECAAFIRDCR